jgi:hypothetical protein
MLDKSTIRTETHECHSCGSNQTIKDPGVGGGRACCGCGCGITSPAYGKASPVVSCSRCGASIYTVELFRGPVCPNCGHWC